MFGMLRLVSAKAWPSDLLREVDLWYLVGLEGEVHLLKFDFNILVLEFFFFFLTIVETFGPLKKVASDDKS